MTARRRMWTVAAVIACLMAVSLVVWSASGDPVLDELTADPMASAAPRPGVVTTIATDQPAEGDGVVFKSTRSRVLRSFRPIQGSPQELASTLREQAVAAGWRFDSPTAGRKQYGFGEGLLQIEVNPYLTPPEVVLTIEQAAPST